MVYKFRYYIGFFILFIGVFLNINMSSIGIFNTVYTESSKETTSIGVPRAIRSDEWLVQTPYYFSQYDDELKVDNDKLNENSIIMYNAPVKDITILGKPFNWGFLFLKKDRAYSFYWISKLVLLFLVSFEFCMIILKKNKLYSLIGALLITYSPGVQWWFMQHLGDLIFFSLAIMTLLYHFFVEQHSILKKLFITIGLTICSIGFILVIYPAFQVPLAYLILFWLIGIFLIEKPKLKLIDYMYILTSILVIVLVCIHFYIISSDAIKLLLGTIYPGARNYNGGTFNLIDLADPISNILLPFKDITVISNNCESAAFYHLMPFIPIILWSKKVYDKIDKLMFVFYLFLIFMMTYLIVGVPDIVSKILLLNFTTDNRLFTIIHFVSMLLTIMLLNNIELIKEIPWIKKCIIILFVTFYWGCLIIASGYITYFGKIVSILILVALAVFVFMIMYKEKIALVMILCIVFLSGITVNPIVFGTGQIDNLKIVNTIKNINKHNEKSRWISDTPFGYGILTASGANTFSNVRFYPDIRELDKISENQKDDEKIYNRYHHRNVEIVSDDKTQFELITPDNILIKMNVKDLDDLGIDYIMSDNDLTLISDRFTLIYGPDKDNIRIYSFSKK